MTQVKVGQVWEDADSRRAGRAFKISNIDNGVATCEIISGSNGKKPNKDLTFIKLKRFVPKYYRLKSSPIKTASIKGVTARTAPMQTEVASTAVSMPSIFRRPSVEEQERNLLDSAFEAWPLNWRKIGSFLMAENDFFEIRVRPENLLNCFNVQIKLGAFFIYNMTTRGNVKTALDKSRNFLLTISNSINSLM